MKHNKSNQPKIRRSWGILNPATKVIGSKKTYTRKDKYKSRYYHEGFVD